MAFPNSGLIKIFPAGTTIVSGQFALNSDATPQPTRAAANLQAYFDARVANLAVAPCLSKNTEIPAASGVYVPSGGDYELQFSPSTIGIEFYDGAYPSVKVATLNFLDADFPMGMVIGDPQVWWNTQTLFGPNRDRDINTVLFKYFGSTVRTFAPGVGLLNGNQASGNQSIIPSLLTQWSIIQLMKSFGLSIDCDVVISGNAGIPRASVTECFILANYSIQTFSITTTTPNALPGNDAEITSGNDALDNFDIDEFKIYWDTQVDETDTNPLFPGWTGGIRIPRNLIFEFTDHILRFRIPINEGIPYGGRRLMLTGTSNATFFVGEFPLQNFNITLVEGSGLYTLVENQRHDTYYDRGTTPVTTTNLKIPDPNVKTGPFNA